jgi:hypothetical protein
MFPFGNKPENELPRGRKTPADPIDGWIVEWEPNPPNSGFPDYNGGAVSHRLWATPEAAMANAKKCVWRMRRIVHLQEIIPLVPCTYPAINSDIVAG